jgi:hypothetical protein
MTQQEILDNELIAEFMGIEVTRFKFRTWDALIIGDEDDAMDYGNLVYYNPNHNWNQLMPVVEKIESLKMDTTISIFEVKIGINRCFIEKHPQWDWNFEIYPQPIEIIDDSINKIEVVWKAVIEFIKWYNEQGRDTSSIDR